MTTREEIEKAYKRNQGAKVKRNRQAAHDFKIMFEAYTELAVWAASQPCESPEACSTGAICIPCSMASRRVREATGRQCASCDHWEGNFCPITDTDFAMGFCGFWKPQPEPQPQPQPEPEPEPDGRTLFGHRVKHFSPATDRSAPPPFVKDPLCEGCAWHDPENQACSNDLNGNVENVRNWTCEFWQGQYGLHS